MPFLEEMHKYSTLKGSLFQGQRCAMLGDPDTSVHTSLYPTTLSFPSLTVYPLTL